MESLYDLLKTNLKGPSGLNKEFLALLASNSTLAVRAYLSGKETEGLSNSWMYWVNEFQNRVLSELRNSLTKDAFCRTPEMLAEVLLEIVGKSPEPKALVWVIERSIAKS
jgi:hypothetical protein